MDPLDHWDVETSQHEANLRYTDDFLFSGNDLGRLWDPRDGIIHQLARLRLRPRILGATKPRFEQRRADWYRVRDLRSLGRTVAAWYALSLEPHFTGLRQTAPRPVGSSQSSQDTPIRKNFVRFTERKKEQRNKAQRRTRRRP